GGGRDFGYRAASDRERDDGSAGGTTEHAQDDDSDCEDHAVDHNDRLRQLSGPRRVVGGYRLVAENARREAPRRPVALLLVLGHGVLEGVSRGRWRGRRE